MTEAHILVVDDNTTSTKMMSILLSREGYRVTIKNDPFDALNWLRNPVNRPDQGNCTDYVKHKGVG